MLADSDKVLEKRFDGHGKSWNFFSLKVWEPSNVALRHAATTENCGITDTQTPRTTIPSLLSKQCGKGNK